MTTAAFDRFLEDYKTLCIQHGLYITHYLRDPLEVWPITADALHRIEASHFNDWSTNSWLVSLKGTQDALGS